MLPTGGISRPSGPGSRRPGGFLFPQHELVAAAGELFDPLCADVVGTALQHHELETHPQRLGEPGKVALRQLVLECLGGSGYDDPGTQYQRRDEVGEALARARARLHDQVSLPAEGTGDRLRHSQLLGPVLVSRECGGGPGEGSRDGGVGRSQARL